MRVGGQVSSACWGCRLVAWAWMAASWLSGLLGPRLDGGGFMALGLMAYGEICMLGLLADGLLGLRCWVRASRPRLLC